MSSSSVIFDSLGPRGRRMSAIVGWLGVILAVGFAALLLWQMRGQLLSWEKWKPFTQGYVWTRNILPGLGWTLLAASLSMALALLLGFVLGVGRLSTITPIRVVSDIFVEFFRSVPVLIMMLFFFSLISLSSNLGDPLLPLAAVVLGLTFYNGSVIAELIRSGVTNLPRGQTEAGLAIGLTPGQTLRGVQLPQAVTAMLPSLLSQLVVVVKDTALGFVVTYPDLTRSLQTLAAYYGNIMVALLVAGIIYILVNVSITSLAGRLEAWIRLGRVGRASAGRQPATAVDDD